MAHFFSKRRERGRSRLWPSREPISELSNQNCCPHHRPQKGTCGFSSLCIAGTREGTRSLHKPTSDPSSHLGCCWEMLICLCSPVSLFCHSPEVPFCSSQKALGCVLLHGAPWRRMHIHAGGTSIRASLRAMLLTAQLCAVICFLSVRFGEGGGWEVGKYRESSLQKSKGKAPN